MGFCVGGFEKALPRFGSDGQGGSVMLQCGLTRGRSLWLRRRDWRLTRVILLVAGGLFTALGIVGMLVPVLPTTPFLLLAAACFCRSSPRAYQWLLNNRVFGAYIRNYREGRGLPVGAKVIVLGLLWMAIVYSTLLVQPFLVKVALLVIALAVTVHLILIPNGAVGCQPAERRQDQSTSDGP